MLDVGDGQQIYWETSGNPASSSMTGHMMSALNRFART